ncbi:MAG: RagB/SusD family nutrient uptake outer membrane protein [Bacteroidia bacterium]|jgi:hypothetical protein|nr:RagB/SusD family nutrient uptake outer membrane protein [Bacteroidia bacterium]
MKKFKYIIVLMIGAVLFTACDDFLDRQPTNSANSATSILDEADAKVAVNGLMRRMISTDYYGRNFIMYADAKGGDLAIRRSGRGLDALYTFSHTQQTNNYSGYWSDLYTTILQTNNIIANIEKIEAEGYTSSSLTHYKGQALTARALLYFDLVRIYGKPYTLDKGALGVPLVLDVPDASLQPLRDNVDAVYSQVVADLKAAEPMLVKTRQNGHINYYTNIAIQARVYLHMNNLSGALAAAETIINSGVYSLYTNEGWVTAWENEFGSESIFELSMRDNEGSLGTASLGYYLMALGKVTGASGQFMASGYFLDRLGEDPDDIRWALMDYDEASEPGNERMGACMKYVGGHALMGDKGANAGSANIKVIRLSEIYLIAAEAALTSNANKAADYLNAIRKRSPNLEPATAATITLDMILDEKSKELFAEGNRYWDMIRLGKPIEYDDEFNITASALTRDKIMDTKTFFKVILPIPQIEIDANPDMQQQQNPGY